MICKRVALSGVLMLALAACGPKGDGAAAPVDSVGGATAAVGGDAGGDAGGAAGGDASSIAGGQAGDSGGAAGAADTVTSTAPIGMISSGTVQRPADQPTPEKPELLADSQRMQRADLLKVATMPLFELPRESDDDQFSYFWVTAREGDSDPTLPMARLLGTLNFANSFILTQWEAKDGAEVTEEGEPTDVTVGDAPAKLWSLGGKSVIVWDNGPTRLRIQSTTFVKDALLEVAAKLAPMQ